MGDWCTIESDPGVFTELIRKFGVKNVQFSEVYNLDDLKEAKPTYGLIFLFKYTEEKDERPVMRDGAPGVFFAQQVISNACATQAIINILLNRPDIQLGDVLDNYRGFASQLPADIRGLAIGNSAEIRNIHNSFQRPEPFVVESRKATKDDDVYHFIAYVPVGNQLWELDGLKEGPVLIGDCTSDNWTDVAKPAITTRMERSAKGGISFALLAMIEDQKFAAEKELTSNAATAARIEAILGGQANSSMDTSSEELPSDPTALQARLAEIKSRDVELKSKVENEVEKQKNWTEENLRRRHNYVPFVFNLLQVLAKKNKLDGLIEQGRKATEERKANATKGSSS